jgi:hypothetical protein
VAALGWWCGALVVAANVGGLVVWGAVHGARIEADFAYAATQADADLDEVRAVYRWLRCWEGLLFFAFVLDAYSRRLVGLAAREPLAELTRGPGR